jgi:hypothetical protein
MSKGTQTDRYNPEGKHTSSIRKNNDGSAAGWHKDKDGNTTTIEQPDANHRTEKYTDKDGKPTGSKSIERDKDGVLTHNYDKDGKATGSMRNRPDGSATGWEKNPDGSIKTIEQPDKANRTETTTKDGKNNHKRQRPKAKSLRTVSSIRLKLIRTVRALGPGTNLHRDPLQMM